MLQVIEAPAPPPGINLNGLPEWFAPLLITVVGIIAVSALLTPIIRAWARRIENQGVGANAMETITQMQERINELEMSNARMHELEERVDFAERVLAQRGEAIPLPAHRTPV